MCAADRECTYEATWKAEQVGVQTMSHTNAKCLGHMFCVQLIRSTKEETDRHTDNHPDYLTVSWTVSRGTLPFKHTKNLFIRFISLFL